LKKVTKRYKNILFRADSSSKIGLGHIMRDLVLAKEFKNAKIFFACQNLEGNIIDKIPYETIILKSNNINELIKIIDKKDIEFLVIDHYEIEYQDEKEIKDKTGVKILSFDDTYKRHYCDILLNQSIHANSNKYANLVPRDTKLLCGKDYILIDEKFYEVKEKKAKESDDYILITLGGGDIFKTIKKIVNFLTKIDASLKIIIIAPQLKTRELSIKNSNIEIIFQTDNMPQLINNAKLVICSLGMVTYEVMFLNKKILPIKTASNQCNIASYFMQNGIDILDRDTLTLNLFREHILKLLKSSSINYDISLINPMKGCIIKAISL
jgi:UDP-2,4-diacetamido-2,4,6-trideoxy-beta-L-altropyranose hydrolase